MAAVSDLLAVDKESWDGKTPRKTVELSVGGGEFGGAGVTKNGEATSSMVPLMRLS